MSEKAFTIAVVLTIPAESYDAALDRADEIVEEMEDGDAGVGYSVVRDYESDNENQRVVYLAPVSEAQDVSDGTDTPT